MPKRGETIGGKYTILSQVGAGRFSEVHTAMSLDDERVAIKVLKDRIDNPIYKEAFEREAYALQLLRHENIVCILDSAITEDGYPYIVTELCQAPLQSIRTWDVSAVTLAKELLSGLQHAHANGIIHRDLKPQHVLYADGGRSSAPKIVDFGIAKIRRRLGPGVTLSGAYTPAS